MAAKKLYPWDAWFARGRFEIRAKTDYRCSQGSMSQQIRNAASVRGLTVSIVERQGMFSVEVHRKEEPCPG